MKKILVLFLSTLVAQTTHSQKLIVTPKGLQAAESNVFTNWDEVLKDSSLMNKTYDVVVTDKNGKTIPAILPNQIIRSISKNSDGSVLFAGLKGSAGDAKVLKSADYGYSWVYLNGGNSLSEKAADVQEIVSSPHNNKIMYAGTWKNGLYKSTDDGDTFQKVDNFPSPDIRSVISHPTDENYVIVATTSHGLVITKDGGETWVVKDAAYLKANFIRIWKLEQSPFDPMEIFALTIYQGLYKTVDFGITWKKVEEGNRGVFYGLGWLDAQNIYCSVFNGTIGTLLKSDDSGSTFSTLENPTMDYMGDFLRIDDDLYAGGEKGLYQIKKDIIASTGYLLPHPTVSHLVEVNDKLLIATWGNGIIIKE